MKELEAKTFLDHLEDLRWTLIKSIGTLMVGVVIGFIFTKILLVWMEWPLRIIGQDPKNFLHALGIMDVLSMRMELSLAAGFLLALPFMLFFVGQFLLPALTDKEKRLLIPVFAVGALLFLAGTLFSFFLVIPQTLSFFLWQNQDLNILTEWTILSYVDFVVSMLVAFGLAFETPLVLVALNHFGIVRSGTLSSYRRHAIMIIVVLACCITPATDPAAG